ncbi:sugar ABC transporter substrate-binding protein [Cetobacterium sp.]|uniref:sugar ABC transporter substrate-binding protein n=1 Tax=Cetobacterium sp. TaxID=2071632 RepID=UPI002FC86CC3
MKKLILLSLILGNIAFGAANKKIALMMSNRSNEFFGVLEQSFVEEAKKLGYTVDVYDAANDATKQPSQVEDAIVKKSAAIVINPLNKDATEGVLNDATSRDIPVVTVDTTVEGVDLLAKIATDNEDGGKFAAEWIVKKSNINPEELTGLIHMRGIDGHTAHIARYKGFKDYLESSEAGEKWNALVEDDKKYIELTGNFAQDVAQNVLESKLSALDPKGKYIVYNENDVMAIGTIGAIQNDSRFNLENFTIIGFDGSTEGKKLVDEKKMAITVVQDFKFIGKQAAIVVDKYLKDNQSPENSEMPIEVIMYPENQNPRN